MVALFTPTCTSVRQVCSKFKESDKSLTTNLYKVSKKRHQNIKIEKTKLIKNSKLTKTISYLDFFALIFKQLYNDLLLTIFY